MLLVAARVAKGTLEITIGHRHVKRRQLYKEFLQYRHDLKKKKLSSSIAFENNDQYSKKMEIKICGEPQKLLPRKIVLKIEFSVGGSVDSERKNVNAFFLV